MQRERGILVLDIGKTNSKASVWTPDGRCVATSVRANADLETDNYRALDVGGIVAWLRAALRELAGRASIAAIVPIAHGAAAAVVADGDLLLPPMSYETALADDPDYRRARDPFFATGSPRLPNGLNLGAQLHHLEALVSDPWRSGGEILTYPQYWAWALCGTSASEMSSLGCHTDLWRPFENRFSDLAQRRGWAHRFAPLRRADEPLGLLREDWAARTGLSRDCIVYCGAHDSNAALYGVRGHPKLKGLDVTVISTGTWFVAMRAPRDGVAPDHLDDERDTLVNVSVEGLPTPSARFMGGREVEALIATMDSPLRAPEFTRDVAPAYAQEVVASGAMILPTFAPGVGPFPDANGRWQGKELDGPARRAAVGLYLALMTDASLELIGARDAVVVEGRFADDLSFLRMLAALRPDCQVYAANAQDGLAFGALRLVVPEFEPRVGLAEIAPFEFDVAAYAAHWREAATA